MALVARRSCAVRVCHTVSVWRGEDKQTLRAYETAKPLQERARISHALEHIGADHQAGARLVERFPSGTALEVAINADACIADAADAMNVVPAARATNVKYSRPGALAAQQPRGIVVHTVERPQ